jgi:hypothetical protein
MDSHFKTRVNYIVVIFTVFVRVLNFKKSWYSFEEVCIVPGLGFQLKIFRDTHIATCRPFSKFYKPAFSLLSLSCKMKGGLSDHLAVYASVCPSAPVILWSICQRKIGEKFFPEYIVFVHGNNHCISEACFGVNSRTFILLS